MNFENSTPSHSHAVATAAWWSKLFGNKRNRSNSGPGSHKHFLGRSGRGPSRSVTALQDSNAEASAKKYESSTSEVGTAQTVCCSSSLSDSSSLGGDEGSVPSASGNGIDNCNNSNLRRVQEHRDLLQAALRISQDSALHEPMPQQRRRMQPPPHWAPLPPPPPVEGERELQKPQQQPPLPTSEQPIQMRRSRSPVLPVIRPWDNSSTSAAAGSSSSSKRPYRHRHDGEFCCPGCDEAANAQAEEMYARATWRMYDRITRARAAAAAVRAMQHQQQQQHGGVQRVPMCVPATVAVPQQQQQPTLAHHRVPLPPGVEDRFDVLRDYDEAEQQQEEDDDDEHAVFSLDMDH